MGNQRQQQTQAKAARERLVRERRARKIEKKRMAAAERAQGGSPTPVQPDDGAADPS
ncbi:MAG TPA: hypothetical protein VFU99_03170 [Gaiellaceae bacterium]|nr:hypothetical protein [Gaiellaceae bacterium]